ncbi:SdpI family protein [Patescibacteria group bacterium]
MNKKVVKISWPIFILQLCIVASMLIVGFLLWDQLPEMMPSHWNINGEIDSYMDKTTWIWIFPGITMLMVLMFPFLSRIDPKKEKYELFRRPWLILQMVFVGFFAYIYFVSLYLTLNPSVPITGFIFGGMGVMFVLIGNYLGKVRQNWFMGIRTPWTLDNEEVWNKTQRLAGWLFLTAGLVVFAEAFIQWQVAWVMGVVIGIAVVVPVVYSYFLHRKLTK